MTTRNVAAVDLGAESGRVMLARFDGRWVQMEEVHRFPNRPVRVRGHRFWDMFALWNETLAGLRHACQIAGQLDSIGVDSWAVDYGLVDEHGLLLGQPYHYRDQRTDGMMDQVFTTVPRAALYQRTGIQFLPFNTLYQLVAQRAFQPAPLHCAHRLLMISDLVHSWLCGELVSERTNATTTQMWDTGANAWATDLLTALDLPTALLPPVVEAGTLLGPVLAELAGDLGHADIVAPATHDTGSAIAATPVAPPGGWGYISSGTWSLVGQELDRPLLTEAALAANFTNEGGVFGTTRFLKNVMGLWLLQECQRQWARAGRLETYDTLLAAVDTVPAFAAVINPDDARFLAPDDMPAAINAYLALHGQAPLETPEQFTRCIQESLVMRSCQVMQECTRLTDQPITGLHVVGGGARNTMMNQWLADALGVPVRAGPVEATALGNALMQLVALGDLSTLSDVRALALQESTQMFFPNAAAHSVWQSQVAHLTQLQS
jgi:rhamnulokinase